MAGLEGVLFWAAAVVILVIAETATFNFICIWFAVGSVMATIAAAMGFGFAVQLPVFFVASVLFLVLARPLVRNKLGVRKQPTNSDMVVGKNGIVTQEINNVRGTGRVSAMGLTWAARSEYDSMIIPADAAVVVNRIEGVKVIVEPVEQESVIRIPETLK